jgi:toxin FitB
MKVEGRILPFEVGAARCDADLAVGLARLVKVFQHPMGCIAAVAVSKKYSIATRNTSTFNAAGLVVINPWLAKC